ncbi:hypothetical protein [Peredibacter starrii]|uniref:Uncharacterized protein n=1 Tax=Peredibacter starrii TaxID=28202 RepID=A0AAX4HLB5_9BACT|nr:hypothetical protein [Peredibacter starrii]WPU64077.1 hypothetical protein SOO65_15385 [Peredibacter starrii]
MKTLLASLLMFSAFASYAADKTIFWCEPIETNKGVEGVLVKEIAGETMLAIYTKSDRFGGVKEEFNKVKFTHDEYKYSYVSAENNSSLEILIMGGKPWRDGWFVGQFLNKKYDVLMNCEYQL